MPLTPQVSVTDHIQGDVNAAIELVEYGDYQCPHCGRAFPIIKAVQQKFGKDLKFVFRNFPLSKIHPQARIAAIASEAANKQGRFWEMHDIIFGNQRNLTRLALLRYAEQIGLDPDQFVSDLSDDSLAIKVDNDFSSGLKSGVSSTPGFYINGEKFNGAWDEEGLTDYIKKKIEALNAELW